MNEADRQKKADAILSVEKLQRVAEASRRAAADMKRLAEVFGRLRPPAESDSGAV